jgi:hypothetical protein
MAYLGSLRGTGRISIDDTDIGSADYRINVYRPKYLNEARGYINADPSVIQQIVDARRAVLELENGGAVTFITPQWDIDAGQARITITGPIPGF